MSGGVGHIPSCQCVECKPPSTEPPLDPKGERWEVRIVVIATIEAPDFYAARQEAARLALAFQSAHAEVQDVTRKRGGL